MNNTFYKFFVAEMNMKFSKKIVYLILVIAVIVQIFVNVYGMYSGFIKITNVLNFISHVVIGALISSVFGAVILYLDFLLFNFTEGLFSWEKHYIKRAIVESFLTISVGILIGVIMTLLVNLAFPYHENIFNVIFRNVVITSIINLFMMAGLEGYTFFRNIQQSKIQNERLLKENAIIKYETLKSQVNPHFLFNSLNVLSALIKKDANEAQNFIDEFSANYRYVMDTLDREVVTIEEEINFVESYLYLQKARFGSYLITQIKIEASIFDHYLPPLAMQTLIENAIKHNKVSESSPLKINIYNNGPTIVIENNLQRRDNIKDSTGFGLQNLKKRYSYISDIEPTFIVLNDNFVASIPIIKPE